MAEQWTIGATEDLKAWGEKKGLTPALKFDGVDDDVVLPYVSPITEIHAKFAITEALSTFINFFRFADVNNIIFMNSNSLQIKWLDKDLNPKYFSWGIYESGSFVEMSLVYENEDLIVTIDGSERVIQNALPISGLTHIGSRSTYGYSSMELYEYRTNNYTYISNKDYGSSIMPSYPSGNDGTINGATWTWAEYPNHALDPALFCAGSTDAADTAVTISDGVMKTTATGLDQVIDMNGHIWEDQTPSGAALTNLNIQNGIIKRIDSTAKKILENCGLQKVGVYSPLQNGSLINCTGDENWYFSLSGEEVGLVGSENKFGANVADVPGAFDLKDPGVYTEITGAIDFPVPTDSDFDVSYIYGAIKPDSGFTSFIFNTDGVNTVQVRAVEGSYFLLRTYVNSTLSQSAFLSSVKPEAGEVYNVRVARVGDDVNLYVNGYKVSINEHSFTMSSTRITLVNEKGVGLSYAKQINYNDTYQYVLDGDWSDTTLYSTPAGNDGSIKGDAIPILTSKFLPTRNGFLKTSNGYAGPFNAKPLSQSVTPPVRLSLSLSL